MSLYMETVLERTKGTVASEFLNLDGVEYFMFEEDFMENNIRCIPMIIRFKMDKAGIKLRLSEWNKFSMSERKNLALMKCNNDVEAWLYNQYLKTLVRKYTGKDPAPLATNKTPSWNDLDSLPELLYIKLREFGWSLSIEQWRGLTTLQRFALLKLCRPGHENKNFPKAMKEFNLLN